LFENISIIGLLTGPIISRCTATGPLRHAAVLDTDYRITDYQKHEAFPLMKCIRLYVYCVECAADQFGMA